MLLLEGCYLDLQVLDLSNNELGNESATYLRPVIKTLVHLNLSGTKLGREGCTDLADAFNMLNQDNFCKGSIKHLDISNNKFDAEGFS